MWPSGRVPEEIGNQLWNQRGLSGQSPPGGCGQALQEAQTSRLDQRARYETRKVTGKDEPEILLANFRAQHRRCWPE